MKIMTATLLGAAMAVAMPVVATNFSTRTITTNIDNWVVSSSQSWWGTEVPALRTHYNVFYKTDNGLQPRGSFTGSSQGDAGDTWKTSYRFFISQDGKFNVEETIQGFSYVWEFNGSNDFGLLNAKVRLMEWDGQSFVEISTEAIKGLTRGPSMELATVSIDGELFSLAGQSLGSAKNRPAQVIELGQGRPPRCKVRFNDNSEAYVAKEAIRLPEKKLNDKPKARK